MPQNSVRGLPACYTMPATLPTCMPIYSPVERRRLGGGEGRLQHALFGAEGGMGGGKRQSFSSIWRGCLPCACLSCLPTRECPSLLFYLLLPPLSFCLPCDIILPATMSSLLPFPICWGEEAGI